MARLQGPGRSGGLRREILGSLLCVAIYRLLSAVPLPFADPGMVQSASGAGGIMDMLTGGNMSRFSIASLGISPYISASIAVQLLSTVVPGISAIQRDGMSGRRKIRQMTFIIGILAAAGTGSMMAANYVRTGVLPADPAYAAPVAVAYMVGCSAALTSLGMYVDDHLFGNGISLFLVAGIMCTLPGQVRSAFLQALYGTGPVRGVLGAALLALAMAGAWILVCRTLMSSLDVPLAYSNKPSTGVDLSTVSVLPVKPLCGSVMPVIFASYVMAIPATVRVMFGIDSRILAMFDMNYWLDPEYPYASVGILAYFVLIYAFGRMSQMMYLNEIEMADLLRRSGCMIQGVAPGQDTEAYLRDRIRIVGRHGSGVLCVVAMLPLVVGKLVGAGSAQFLGTSLILIASVCSDLRFEYSVRKGCMAYESCRPMMAAGRLGGDPYALLKKARS